MNQKSLLVIDIRIAKIRDDIARGIVMSGAMDELDALMEKRQAIIGGEESAGRLSGATQPGEKRGLVLD